MSAAVRGDFARLRARGVDSTMSSAAEPPPDPVDEAVQAENDTETPAAERRSFFRIFRGG